MNSHLRVSGYSPYHYVFGRDPWQPTSTLCDDSSLAAQSAAVYDSDAQRAEMYRQAAIQATISLDSIESMRRAVHAPRREGEQFTVGDMVYWWRTPAKFSKVLQRETGWHGPGLVVSGDPGQLLIFWAGGVVHATPAQCRKWSRDERDMLCQYDALIKLGKEQFASRRQLGYRDVRGAAPPTLAEHGMPPTGASDPTIFGAPAPPAATPAALPTAPSAAPAAVPPSAPAAVDVRPIEPVEIPVAEDVAEDVDVSPPETEQCDPRVSAPETEQRVAALPERDGTSLQQKVRSVARPAPPGPKKKKPKVIGGSRPKDEPRVTGGTVRRSRAASSTEQPEKRSRAASSTEQPDEMDRVLKELEDASPTEDEASDLGDPQIDEMDQVLQQLMDEVPEPTGPT